MVKTWNIESLTQLTKGDGFFNAVDKGAIVNIGDKTGQSYEATVTEVGADKYAHYNVDYRTVAKGYSPEIPGTNITQENEIQIQTQLKKSEQAINAQASILDQTGANFSARKVIDKDGNESTPLTTKEVDNAASKDELAVYKKINKKLEGLNIETDNNANLPGKEKVRGVTPGITGD